MMKESGSVKVSGAVSRLSESSAYENLYVCEIYIQTN